MFHYFKPVKLAINRQQMNLVIKKLFSSEVPKAKYCYDINNKKIKEL
jgi:hypothetical protein